MRDLSLLVDYMEGKYSPEDFRDILLADEEFCDFIRVTYATEIVGRDVDIISAVSRAKTRGGVLDDVASKILEHFGTEYDKTYSQKYAGASPKALRKRLAKEYAEQQKKEFYASLPMPDTVFKKLFAYLDMQLGKNGCDGTLSLTEKFLQKNGLDAGAVTEWLCDHGGGCDCEVLFNVEELFHEYR